MWWRLALVTPVDRDWVLNLSNSIFFLADPSHPTTFLATRRRPRPYRSRARHVLAPGPATRATKRPCQSWAGQAPSPLSPRAAMAVKVGALRLARTRLERICCASAASDVGNLRCMKVRTRAHRPPLSSVPPSLLPSFPPSCPPSWCKSSTSSVASSPMTHLPRGAHTNLPAPPQYIWANGMEFSPSSRVPRG